MSKKYAVFPQKIMSRSDGDWHYISAQRLMELYNVDPKDCVIVNERDFQRSINLDGLVFLKPQYDGDYRLETAIKRSGLKGTSQ